ncbi:MAG: hypothetical protein KH284_12380 [Clostridiales bacterium]|nr:hypothetical protein [Clostridiales bacterium]
MADLAAYTDDFYEFEKEEGLFEDKIEDIYYWALIRDRIHDNILVKQGLIGAKSQTVASSIRGKVKAFARYVFHACINVFQPYPQVDTLIINHPRKVNVNGTYMDIYSQWLVDKLKQEKKDYLVLDFPLNWSQHLIKKDGFTRNLENFSIVTKVYYKFFAKNKIKDNPKLLALSKKLADRFGNDGDLLDVCFQQINIFRADYRYYRKLLQKVRPKQIYYVVINSMFGLIAAAHDLQIPVEEIQHGLMCRYHLNYSFPYNNEIPYFPDRFCLFGAYWGDITPLPLKKDQLDYYENRIREYEPGKNRVHKNNKVMFLTQLNFSPEMFTFLKAVLENPECRGLEIIIKLHPSEFHVWKELYPYLEDLLANHHISLIDNFDIPLYSLFQQVDSVVGVASTSLFEALYFGCDVYLLNIPGVDWVRPLMDERFSTFIENPEEFPEKVRSHKDREVDMSYIFYDKQDVEA